jgi:REP-associated tyrosine transposase
MPRPLRDQSAGIRHVTCRGNRRQSIFLDDVDRRRYTWLLDEACTRYGWRIHGYCLMGNHVHLVAAVGANSISRGMQWLSGKYGQLFNRRHRQSGHLFQGRFRSEIVGDERYALEVVRYVDLNPVRAGLVPDPTLWAWSSHRALVGLATPHAFHDVDTILSPFSCERKAAQLAYARYVGERLSETPVQRKDMPHEDNRGQTPG